VPRDISFSKELGGELSSGAPGVLLQKGEYAKVVLQHRHLPSKNGHVDVVEFTDPGLCRRLGCRGFLAGLGHDSVSVAERRASACQQALFGNHVGADFLFLRGKARR
jgi:hypothetical protein